MDHGNRRHASPRKLLGEPRREGHRAVARLDEKLGFSVFGGEQAENWLILRSGAAIIGLFQGMCERNTLTFNPGWDADGDTPPDSTDVRQIQRRLKAAGIQPAMEADESGSGPASFMVVDPDGNPILFDQHLYSINTSKGLGSSPSNSSVSGHCAPDRYTLLAMDEPIGIIATRKVAEHLTATGHDAAGRAILRTVQRQVFPYHDGRVHVFVACSEYDARLLAH